MIAQWTGDLIGKMHIHGIKASQLAAKAGLNPKYMSCILNGKRNPPKAEQRLNAALDELIAELEAE